MKKLSFVICALQSCLSYANVLTCDAINKHQLISSNNGIAIINFNRNYVETIDYTEIIDDNPDATKRIYSRTYSDPSNRGGYVINYCNPDDNSISPYSGIRIYSHCNLANNSNKVFFSFNLNKEFSKGNFSIDNFGSEIIKIEMDLENCR